MTLDTSIALEMLKRMKLIRITEETIAQKYSEWKMRCPTHLCSGQEVCPAAVSLLLKDSDFAVSGHRAHGHYLAKGGDLNRMIAEIYGKVTGCSKGKGGSMHLIDKTVGFMGSTAIVGGTIPVGVGLALAAQIKQSNQISCVYFGDGAVEEGVFYESLNFAKIRNLPVLFICENNFFSVYSPLSVRQPSGRRIQSMVEGIGVTGNRGDGNNPEEVYRLVKAAVYEIRSGKGPRFLEFETYRWREHCGPNYDNDLGYRSKQEFLDWKKRDPIKKLESSLLDSNQMTTSDISTMEVEIEQQVSDAFQFAEESNFPHKAEIFTDLYTDR